MNSIHLADVLQKNHVPRGGEGAQRERDRQTETNRETERDRQTPRDRETEKKRDRDRHRQRESKTLILKDI